MLEYKINLLKESVYYLKPVEREALVELSFQMKIRTHQRNELVVK